MTWFTPADLPDAHPFLLGLLEVPPRDGIALELHVERYPGCPTLGVWLDERGRWWAAVEAGQA